MSQHTVRVIAIVLVAALVISTAATFISGLL